MYKCDICGKEFTSKTELGGHKSGHSRLGKLRNGDPKPIVFCKNCGKEVPRRRNSFCSMECYNDYQRTHSWYRGMDVTTAQMIEYRQSHKVCEICGRPERLTINGRKCNLAVDHDHKTNKFRGLLCYSCNTKLAWYENWKDNIERYLSEDADIV